MCISIHSHEVQYEGILDLRQKDQTGHVFIKRLYLHSREVPYKWSWADARLGLPHQNVTGPKLLESLLYSFFFM